MRSLSQEDRRKIEAVKLFLAPYAEAKENCLMLREREVSDYSRRQIGRCEALMRQIESAIGLLPVSRGKTVIEKRFLCGDSWSKIYLDLQISQTTALTVYRAALLELHDRMLEHNLL